MNDTSFSLNSLNSSRLKQLLKRTQRDLNTSVRSGTSTIDKERYESGLKLVEKSEKDLKVENKTEVIRDNDLNEIIWLETQPAKKRAFETKIPFDIIQDKKEETNILNEKELFDIKQSKNDDASCNKNSRRKNRTKNNLTKFLSDTYLGTVSSTNDSQINKFANELSGKLKMSHIFMTREEFERFKEKANVVDSKK